MHGPLNVKYWHQFEINELDQELDYNPSVSNLYS